MNYLLRAEALGQDVSELKKGNVVTSDVLVKSLDDFKSLFASGIDGERRGAHSMRAANTQLGDYPGAAAMSRLADHVFGCGELSPADAEFAKSIFPVKVTVVSGAEVTISSNQVIGPTTAPYAINADTITFAGGSITVMNTIFTLTANTLKVLPGGTVPYHIGILGATGPKGSPGPVGSSTPGQAQAGNSSSAPTPGICTGASNGGDGHPGAPGGTGIIGGGGGNGLPSLVSNITVASFPNPNNASFVIYTRSGAGGVGGVGGTGGAGQQGGNGGSGCNSGCEGTDGGNGGTGGAGGQGGPGGPGGNGADGQSIYISFPAGPGGAPAPNPYLLLSSDAAPVGAGGAGGVGGAGGAGGNGGSGGKHKSDGQAGSSGANGGQGVNGSPGSTPGSAGNFVPSYT